MHSLICIVQLRQLLNVTIIFKVDAVVFVQKLYISKYRKLVALHLKYDILNENISIVFIEEHVFCFFVTNVIDKRIMYICIFQEHLTELYVLIIILNKKVI